MDKRSIDEIDEIPAPCMEADALHDALREWRYACDTRYNLQKYGSMSERSYTAMYDRHLKFVEEVREGRQVIRRPSRPEGRLSLKKLREYERQINAYLKHHGCTRFMEVKHGNSYYSLYELTPEQYAWRLKPVWGRGDSGVARTFAYGLSARECMHAMESLRDRVLSEVV